MHFNKKGCLATAAVWKSQSCRRDSELLSSAAALNVSPFNSESCRKTSRLLSKKKKAKISSRQCVILGSDMSGKCRWNLAWCWNGAGWCELGANFPSAKSCNYADAAGRPRGANSLRIQATVPTFYELLDCFAA